MTSSTFKKIIFLAIAFLLITHIKITSSATALATISANIVPLTSISSSGTLILTARTNKQYTNTPNKSTENSVILSTASSKDFLKFKISNSREIAYDISISPIADMSDKTGKITLDNLHIQKHEQISKYKKENGLIIDGTLLDTNTQKTINYKGQADITVHYN